MSRRPPPPHSSSSLLLVLLVWAAATTSSTSSGEGSLGVVGVELAALRKDIADQPIANIAKGFSQFGEMNREVEEALDEHGQAMVRILEEADQLRLSTVRELVDILTVLQAVDFLVASKKLHLCMHKWGKNRDHLPRRASMS
ncbi:LOW QUALITY PROTEIN: protein DOG1-like 1 [Prunus avium]|uniref:LOW QUALITY PROTEIN: protein DOG1-like 1 n=1 Tax=Prunus avium TaxID=42229 RepID=A0A6P5SH90_PRUAV|nr:LOW QUALITY PROTEIN: protein DOG1-like 1 [Prunus avium]